MAEAGLKKCRQPVRIRPAVYPNPPRREYDGHAETHAKFGDRTHGLSLSKPPPAPVSSWRVSAIHHEVAPGAFRCPSRGGR